MINGSKADWQVAVMSEMADDWVQTVEKITGLPNPLRGAQLLWMRGVRSPEALRGFCHAKNYVPASPFDFGEEMELAVERLVLARENGEKVAIWGDFDADGITSTAVLWDGLRQFFDAENQLTYFIPNRLKESHGLSMMGIAQLSAQGVNLIVTCDTGSTNPDEIEYAQSLGIDVIVTDHHTLPEQRPAVVAIVNPRALASEHAMASLSGVAVAYKLVEALYEKLPDVPTRPLRELVDLVAIGLIADLVELKGDCRYLAQIGIAQLQTHLKTAKPVRPGVAELLKLCRRAGDRPTDISFGIGPRINAVSRIYGDASFCVELLTSTDAERCRELAGKAELANARRKALQSDVLRQVKAQLAHSDLSTTGVIVLCDEQWPVGVLGLVAGQVAQQYGRPTILLTQDAPDEGNLSYSDGLIRGSARSVNQIDLYDLVDSQAHLLTGFGGHPFAAGLSLPKENLSLFRSAINQQYRQKMSGRLSAPTVKADLTVTVAELGRELFQELKLLEPCGMGNAVPKLLIRDCWFENVWHQKLKDRMGGKIGYIKASFLLCDEGNAVGRQKTTDGYISGQMRKGRKEEISKCPGLWWGHYKDDLPPGRWDVVAELDYNSHPKSRRYEIRLIDIQPAAEHEDSQKTGEIRQSAVREGWLLDRRYDRSDDQPDDRSGGEGCQPIDSSPIDFSPIDSSGADADREPLENLTDLVVDDCPRQWKALQLWHHQSEQTHQPVALAYASPEPDDPIEVWKQLLGIAKYLSRTQMAVSPERLAERLGVSDRALSLGLHALTKSGFTVDISAIDIRFKYAAVPASVDVETDHYAFDRALGHFIAAIQEESFRRQYFYRAPVTTLQSAIATGDYEN